MDQAALDELLECSVCMDSLDETSKVCFATNILYLLVIMSIKHAKQLVTALDICWFGGFFFIEV